LTLCFLGEIHWNQTHLVAQIATKVLRSQSRVTLTCEGLGGFPSLEQPRVLWAGIRELAPIKKQTEVAAEIRDDSGLGCPRLQWMVAALNQAYLEQRFYPDTKPWAAHVTLARLTGGRGERTATVADEFQEFEHQEFGLQTVHELKLMSSERSQAGPVYRPIATIPLGK
jgi:2'-5' RNA ligase